MRRRFVGGGTPLGTQPPWVFGNEPLPEVVELAQELRALVSTALALEAAPPELAELTARVRAARTALAAHLPADLTPRVGRAADRDARVYLDHSRHIGAYHPCFPEYTLRCADDRADGEVTFPICYEGPPGAVHGGFLALFFDCVLQHLSCDMGVTGSTTRLAVRYRRPTPLLRPLRVTATRRVEDDRIRSEAQLLLDGDLLCSAEMSAVAGRREQLPVVSPRRVGRVAGWRIR